MKDQQQRLTLFNKYLNGQCTLEEVEQLMQYFNSDQRWQLEELVLQEFQQLEFDEHHYTALPERILEGIKARIVDTEVAPVRRMLWPKIAVAASIALAVMVGGYYYYQSKIVNRQSEVVYQNDVAPGKNGATLTLADGRKILINDAVAGNIATQAGVTISKDETGQLVYTLSPLGGDAEGRGGFNTLTTTRGEQTKVRLPDGTLVFLNAQSSLRYPANFAQSLKREVSLSGEGYFEVAKDKAHPFIVKTDKQDVEVLGTHFNISAYTDESHINTTLLEGSVRVSSTKNNVVLAPGHQASLDEQNIRVKAVNVDEVVSWKNGMFAFSDLSLEEIMKKIARWYNVEVSYMPGVNKYEAYGGSVSRYENVSRVLSKLELTGSVHFKIEGRHIIVAK